jgi:hypothetical protein
MRYGLMALCNQPDQFPELIDLTINDNMVPVPVDDGDDMQGGLMELCRQPDQFPELIDLTINDNMVPVPVDDGDDMQGGLMELCRQQHRVNDDNDDSRGLKPNIPDISESKKKRKIKNPDEETDVKKIKT